MLRMLVLIDNYDSFTYNLVQYLGDLDISTHVVRNDQLEVDAVFDMKPRGIMISPGPSTPDHAGICLDLVRAAVARDLPLFGVFLGHKCTGRFFGGQIVQAPPMHGKKSVITHSNTGVFQGLPSSFSVTRYHSLVVEDCPDGLEVTAQTADGLIMGLQHKSKPVYGVQFHPESIATQYGHDLLKNFTDLL